MSTLTHTRTPLLFATLIGGSLLFGPSFAQQTEDHAAHHPADAAATEAAPAAPAAARVTAMRERMERMRQMRDPAERMRLMEEQMADIEGMMQAMPADCPMMSGDRPMGPGMMKGGMMGGAMPGMMGGQGRGPEAMHQRMEAMEKRMDAFEKRAQ